MAGALALPRGLLRREVLAVCAVAFLADVVAGIIIPSFSLYARSLGASLVLVGALTTLSGLTQLLGSFPIGLLSDRVGRRRVLVGGMLGFAGAAALMALAPGPGLLVPSRLLFGLALVGTFWIAAAHLGDVVAAEERGLAFGLLTTAMGLGFAVGPFAGGRLADAAGPRAGYLFAAAVGVAGAGLALAQLPGGVPGFATARVRPTLRQSLRVGRDRHLVSAAIGNVLTSVGFGGAVATFFPLYGAELGLREGTIGGMFALRAVVSTVARVPCGLLAGAIGSRRVMLGSLGLELVAVLGLGGTERPAALGALLVLEGVAFGGFLTAAHAFIAEHTVAATRGAALGLYSAAGSVGGTLAPLGLGLVASQRGLPAVFVVTAGLLAAGLVLLGWMGVRAPAWAPPGPATPVVGGEGEAG